MQSARNRSAKRRLKKAFAENENSPYNRPHPMLFSDRRHAIELQFRILARYLPFEIEEYVHFLTR